LGSSSRILRLWFQYFPPLTSFFLQNKQLRSREPVLLCRYDFCLARTLAPLQYIGKLLIIYCHVLVGWNSEGYMHDIKSNQILITEMSEKNSKLVLRFPSIAGSISNSSPAVAKVPRVQRNESITGILHFKMEGDRILPGAVCDLLFLEDWVLKDRISGVAIVEMAEKWSFALFVKQIQYALNALILISKM